MPGPRLPAGHSQQALAGQGGYHVYTDNANVDRKGKAMSTVEESRRELFANLGSAEAQVGMLQDRTVDGFRLAYGPASLLCPASSLRSPAISPGSVRASSRVEGKRPENYLRFHDSARRSAI